MFTQPQLRSAFRIIAIACTSWVLACRPAQPPTPPPEPTVHIPAVVEVAPKPPEIQWQEHGPGVIERSEREGRPIFLYITAPGCERCDTVQNDTLTDRRVVQKLNERFISVKLNLADHVRLAGMLRLHLLPAIILLAQPGDMRVIVQGVIPPEKLLEVIDKAIPELKANEVWADVR